MQRLVAHCTSQLHRQPRVPGILVYLKQVRQTTRGYVVKRYAGGVYGSGAGASAGGSAPAHTAARSGL